MRSNPLLILETLDRHLHSEVALYVYGRSALALGYAKAPAACHATMDVDAILPSRDLVALESNEDFWQAQEKTNAELQDSGLYCTHLFEEKQVILTPDWLQKTVALRACSFRNLRLHRPSTPDLVLTKMMRVDPQDRDDIRFLVAQPDSNGEEIRRALDSAVVPAVEEIGRAFAENRHWLLSWLK